jgi:tetratricopeptide (TPR) repeat protein
MHRSGTSALSRSLNLAGLYLPEDVLAANQDNPRGYWEPKAVVNFNTQLMQHFDRHWADPKPLPKGWEYEVVSGYGAEEAAAVLKCEFDRAKHKGAATGIVIKDPRLSLTLPIWRAAARMCGVEPACLIACRNPTEVSHSLQSRDGISPEHALHLWLLYMLGSEVQTRGMKRAVVSYDALLNDWRTTLQTTLDAIGWPKLDGLRANEGLIDSFLDQKLRHHNVASNNVSDPITLETTAQTVYTLFLAPQTKSSAAKFDRLAKQQQTNWQQCSPGPDRSDWPQSMAGWYGEKSWILLAEGRLEDAIVACQTAIKMAPATMRFHFILGTLLARAERLPEAVTAFKAAIARDNTQIRVYRGLATALKRLGDIDGAITAIRGAIKHDVSAAEDHYILGDLLRKSGQGKAAIAELEQAITLDNRPVHYHQMLREVLAETRSDKPG